MHFEEIITAIKERREAFQITQEDLSKRSGVGLRTLKQLESGKGNPTLTTLQKLGDALGLTLVFQVKDMTR
ncbi:MAG: helix-turn-helix transcriptional regulator [Flavobacteriaceae bacterium]|nr:helix-turn-helix transcriptional regulator [Flavobacteriaceae bacterium]